MVPIGVSLIITVTIYAEMYRRYNRYVRPSYCTGHPGIIYHYTSDKNWEGFYFRPHSTGTNSAIQSTCMVDGKSTYPKVMKADVPTDGSWFRATVKVTSTQATLTFNGVTLTVDRCAKGVAGGVGILK